MKARWTVRWSAAILLALLLLPLAVSAAPPQGRLADVDPAVLQAAGKDETTFWVIMRTRADIEQAQAMPNRLARGQFVVDRLQSAANTSQADIRKLLQSRGNHYQSFWIANAIRVTGDRATLQILAARPDVAKILPDKTYAIPAPLPGKLDTATNSVEWGIERIRAPQVWSTFNDRGEGIVVASIDSGVLYTHSALVDHYRGRQSDGSFNHNYNWFDPSSICGRPSLAPCDNVGHGTHTMGIMVGDDGDPGANQIGVAPHAKWITAKGCETSSCSAVALLSAGQWVLAPTDLNGRNPRPDLRPDIVNNSWGGNDGSDPFYQAMVRAWVASGIFPVFANGNVGPPCASVGAPGSYTESYSVGAFDNANVIANFSSRGAAPAVVGGAIKPNITAPGVNIRSSWNDGGYNSLNGTSFATPHVAGTVALIWSAAPSLLGDIADTRALLDRTAIDTSDLTCGGTPGNNNVWGEGRLDAFAAVQQAPRGPSGTLQGRVTNTSSAPIAGATVHATGPVDRTTVTDPAGRYSFRLPVGTYSVTVSLFGYLDGTASGLVVGAGGTTTHDFSLVAAPAHTVSGHVRDTLLQPIANATVTIQGTPIAPTTTDADGFYSFANVPEGSYEVAATAGRCADPQTQNLVVDSDETLDFALVRRTDSFGYFCELESIEYVEASNVISLTGDDAATQINLPFPFLFYGQTYTSTYVVTNGYLNFITKTTTFSNDAIPSTAVPNGAVYPFWDDVYVDSQASVRTQLLGTAPARAFVIEWRNVRFFSDLTKRFDFEVELQENGQILMQYRNIGSDSRLQGDSATIGIENADGTIALQYSHNEAVVADGLAVRYLLPPSGFVEGHVTDANDHLPVAGAQVRALRGATEIRSTTTDVSGFYQLMLPLGSYTLEASATNYITASTSITLSTQGEVITHEFALATARAEVSPASLQFLLLPGRSRSQSFVLRNAGGATLNWTFAEDPDTPWLSESASSGTLAPNQSQNITLTANSSGLAPGVYDTALLVRSNSGRQPSMPVHIRLIVPAYQVSVNAGGGAYTDVAGDVWGADRAYAPGGYGYLYARSRTIRSTHEISGTVDDLLYQTQRDSPIEYRFDGLSAGVYQVELRFAELKQTQPNKRLFDVIVEGTLVLPAQDIFLEVGRYVADDKTFFASVTDGHLDIRFVPRYGYSTPVVSALRVTQRPDRQLMQLRASPGRIRSSIAAR